MVVTRAAHQARALIELLQAEGADTLALPTIAIEGPEDPGPLDESLRDQSRYDRLLLGSANAVAQLEARAALCGLRWTLPVLCVGSKTSALVEASKAFEGPVRTPKTFRAEAMVEELKALGGLEGQRFLFPRPPTGRTALLDLLTAEGAQVEAPVAYRIVPAERPSKRLLTRLERADAFTFLSGETLACFLQLLSESKARALLSAAAVAVIGPVAKARAASLNVRVDVVPERATTEALVDALARMLGASGAPVV